MAITLPHDFAQAAQIFYAAGRQARQKGEPREVNTSPTNPNNAAYWDQSYKTDPALQLSMAPHPYGTPDLFWWIGWDDQDCNWPDRGWQNAMGLCIYNPPINYTGQSSSRNRLYELVNLYRFGWLNYSNPAYGTGPGQTVPTGGGEYTQFLTSDEIVFEIQRAQKDRASAITPPLAGYVDPSTAGIPPLGGGSTTNTNTGDTSLQTQEYPYNLYNWQAALSYEQQQPSAFGGLSFGNGGMSNILPLLFLTR
jgi:hypothetical protein